MANYDYKNNEKITEEFKNKFKVVIKGKETIKLEGLTAIAHEKGMKEMITKIIQFPSESNQWTAICETTVIGYDYDPITDGITEVTYTDIGDANEANCGAMVKSAYIRMASTRSQARALRKYTNIDMVCFSELDYVTEERQEQHEPIVTNEELLKIKALLKEKRMTQSVFDEMLMKLFNHTNYTSLTSSQAKILTATLQYYVTPEQ